MEKEIPDIDLIIKTIYNNTQYQIALRCVRIKLLESEYELLHYDRYISKPADCLAEGK